MTKLDRYLLSEMVLPFIGSVLLIVVMLVGNTLYALIQTIVKANISWGAIAKLVVFNIPTLLVLTLPAAMALSAAWCVNRLARDSEITAIRMAGVPLRRLFLPIYTTGLIVSVSSFFIADRVVPRAQHEFQQTQLQMAAYAFQATPSVAENKVFVFEDYAFSIQRITHPPSGDLNKLRLAGITIFHNNPAGGSPELITASTGTYDHDIWTLRKVVVHTIGPDGVTATEIASDSFTLDLHVPITGLAESAFRQPDELSMEQLGQQMRELKLTHLENPEGSYVYYC